MSQQHAEIVADDLQRHQWQKVSSIDKVHSLGMHLLRFLTPQRKHFDASACFFGSQHFVQNEGFRNLRKTGHHVGHTRRNERL